MAGLSRRASEVVVVASASVGSNVGTLAQDVTGAAVVCAVVASSKPCAVSGKRVA